VSRNPVRGLEISPDQRILDAFLIPNSTFRTALRPSGAFTLFEVLISLGVFAIAVTGLAIALDSAVMAAFEARERALARVVLDSRLSAVMSDPPVTGRRTIDARDNNGVRVDEVMEKFEAKATNGVPVTGLWKIRITADWGRRDKSKETAEILFFRP
jgi:type II secretory pathway pseudopilin PulG